MDTRDIIIVGGGPAGLSAAIFTSLDGWHTTVFEGSWVGGQAAIAYTVMNYPGFPPGEGAILAENFIRQVSDSPPQGVGTEIKHEQVMDIDAGKMVVLTKENQYQTKAIIMATGSVMQSLGVQGEKEFVDKGITYYAVRDYEKFKDKDVLVVGGGNTTAKSAFLAKTKARKVTIIHRNNSMRAYPLIVRRLQKEGIDIRYNTELVKIEGNDHVQRAVLINNATHTQEEAAVDWIVICTGTDPDIRLAKKCGLSLNQSVVKVDESLMTSAPGIFACGEVTGCDKHLITCASSGAAAGMAASEYLAMERIKRGETFKGAINGKYAVEYAQMLGEKT
jgi:thioredoxin reductase (NADPH)